MYKERVHTVGEALAYITECNLATVDQLAMRKTPPKGELRRQTSIAQTAIDWMIEMKVNIPKEDRATDILKHFNSSVEQWANRHKPTS